MIHLKRLAKGLLLLAAVAIAFAILFYVINQWPGVLLTVLLISFAYVIGGIFME